MKKKKENWCQFYLASKTLIPLLEKCDSELAEKCRLEGCLLCQAKLHRANYTRKPRSRLNESDCEDVVRFSFCCERDGCRKRHTPPSVRFLGRKVYWGVRVVLIAAMRHGLKPERVKELCQSLEIDRRTLERWRAWWLEHFVQSPFWKIARARFSPRLCQEALPLSLCEAFRIDRRDRLLNLLKFLSPITTTSIPLERAI